MLSHSIANIVRYSSAFLPIVILFILALPLCLLLLCLSWSIHVLEIAYPDHPHPSLPPSANGQEAERGGRIFWTPISPGDRFILEQIHSVQLCRVTDEFEIDRHYRMFLVSTTFSDHGAGLPYSSDRGETFSVQYDGRFKISGMCRFAPEILLRVGREHGNTFTFGVRLNLSEMCGDALLTVRTRKCTVFKCLLWKMLGSG